MAYNMLENLRLKRLFGSLFKPSNAPVVQSPLNPPDSGLAKLRARTTPDMDAYRSYLAGAPNPDDYRPGKVNKILSAIAGMAEGIQKGPTSGISVAKGLMDRPYDEAKADYAYRGGRLKDLADLEYRGLKDNTDLEVKIAADERARIKEAGDEKYTDAQIKNLESQIKSRGLTLQKNEKTGEMEVVNIADGSRKPIGQFAESIGEKDARELGIWKDKYHTEQSGRRELQNDTQRHQEFMAGLNFDNDKRLAKFRDDLSRNNPNAAESNAAYLGATGKVLQENPELKDQLFITDPATGAVTIKDKYNADVYNMFVQAVRQEAAKKLGEKPEVPGFTAKVPNDVPSVNMPGNDTNARKTAIDELAKIGIAQPNEAQIQEAIKDLSTTPSVNIPPVSLGIMNAARPR